MGVGDSTLGAGVRVKLTFGCAMGAATLGAGGRLKLTLLGVWHTLGSPGGRPGLRFGRRRWVGLGETVGSAVGSRAGARKGCGEGGFGDQIVGGGRGGGGGGFICGASHWLKRSRRVEIACSCASLVVEGVLEMALVMASRLWTMVSAGVTVGMVRWWWRKSTVSEMRRALVFASMTRWQR